MTLDYASKHYQIMADNLENSFDVGYIKDRVRLKNRVKELRQLAEWLEDYKRLKQEEKYTTDVNISDMMHEIYMEGMNMGGEYQGCWVRYKDIEKAFDKHFGKEKE